MQTKQIKKILIDRDLTLSQIARQIDYPASELSIRQMLSDLLYERRWYPRLADAVESQFGIHFTRPAHFEPKVRLKNAA